MYDERDFISILFTWIREEEMKTKLTSGNITNVESVNANTILTQNSHRKNVK